MNTKFVLQAYESVRAYYLDFYGSFSKPGAEIPKDYDSTLAALKVELEGHVATLRLAEGDGDPDVWYALGDAVSMRFDPAFRQVAAEARKEEAAKWFVRAAEAGHTRAMTCLATYLRQSQDEDVKKKSLSWLHKAADLGSAHAMAMLGFSYRDAEEADIGEAIHWFTKAVENGDLSSMRRVGHLYLRYLKQHAEALPWLLKSAEQGDIEGYYLLGELYGDAQGSLFNPVEAKQWYGRAIEESTPSGSRDRYMYDLAILCRDTTSTASDLDETLGWLRRIINEGQEKSEYRRKAVRLVKSIG